METKIGRPTEFKPEYVELAFNYVLLGAKDAQLAEFFGVSEQTINTWKKKHPEFLESLKKGKEQADAEIASSLFHRAKGYTITEEREEESEGGEGGFNRKKVKQTKHIPTDTTAAIFWLKNRQPKLWRDKQETEISGELKVDTPLSERLTGGSKR